MFQEPPPNRADSEAWEGGRPGDCEAGGAECLSVVINWLQFSLPLCQGSHPPRFPRQECLLY